ncbi:hypothetical protein D5086_023279 [Populus alba]|uniref:Uncharacterized protein n=1 Tax=Populus alba TaxID=43335 RepID=A0ACC4BB43_POPAL
MSIEDATAGPLKTQSPGRKRSKVVGTELPNTLPRKVGTTPAPSKRQYLTRSKATAIPCMGPQPKNPAGVFQLLHSSDDSAPHPPSDGLFLLSSRVCGSCLYGSLLLGWFLLVSLCLMQLLCWSSCTCFLCS